MKKYLFYALGEIILVMIGILLALQVNNWNEHRKEQQKIRTYLDILVEDLRDDQRHYQNIVGRELFRYYSLQYLYQSIGFSEFEVSEGREVNRPFENNTLWEGPLPDQFDHEFANAAFIWSTRIAEIEINLATVEEMKNTGIFSLLKEQIKDSINNYYVEWQWRLGQNNYNFHKELIEKWRESLMQKGIITARAFDHSDPIKVLREDPYKAALIAQMIQESAWRYSSAIGLDQLAGRLIEFLEKENHTAKARRENGGKK